MLLPLILAAAMTQLPPARFVVSKDGTNISYDVTGSGPTIILLHGESAEAYKTKLAGTNVTLVIVDGLTHPEEFDQVDRVFPRELEFTKSHAR